MILFLLLFLSINTHHLSAAASTQAYSPISERISKAEQRLREHIYPVTAVNQDRLEELSTTNAPNVTQAFSRYTKNVVNLNQKLHREVNGYSAVLSADYIDELLHHAKNKTIPAQDLRTEVARCTLGFAERVRFMHAPSSAFISIEEIEPISEHYIYGEEELTPKKVAMMTELLYAVCHPASATHISVYSCLNYLGFSPKLKPLDTQDTQASTDFDDEESYAWAAETIYELIAEELTFIKSHLAYLAPNDAKVSADPSYYYALLNRFHVKQQECEEEPALEKPSFCFDTQLAKVLLLLDHHYSNYVDNNIEVVNFANLIRWRFNLFTDIKA